MSDREQLVQPLIRTRQYREFTSEPVSDDDVSAVTDVGRWSGSGSNSQPWRFIIVRDEPTLRQIADAGMPTTRSMRTAMVAIAIVLPQVEGAAVSNAFDEGRAAERMLIAGQLLGLGSGICWVGKDVRPLVAKLLGLPDDRFVRTFVVLGTPTEGARGPKSAAGEARLPRGETVFDGRWPG
jgi:nitroreductase